MCAELAYGEQDVYDEEITEQLEYKNGSELTLAGIITGSTTKSTRQKERMMFLTLEDATSECELIAFPSVLERYAPLLVLERAVAVRGKLSIKDDGAKLLVSSVIPLCRNGTEKTGFESVRSQVRASTRADASEEEKKPKRLYLRVEDTSLPIYKRALALAAIFNGQTPVIFYDRSKGEYVGSVHVSVELSDFLIAEYKALLGEDNVVYR